MERDVILLGQHVCLSQRHCFQLYTTTPHK